MIALIAWPATIAQAQVVHVWDLADTERAGQFTVYNPDEDDAEFGTPVTAGDLDGDGLDDLVISAMAGDGPDNGRFNAGEVAVCFSRGPIGGTMDLAADPPAVVTLYGEDRRDVFGIKSHVADLDGDGAQDLMVGAFYADTDAFLDAGKLYIFSQGLLRNLLAGERRLDLAAPEQPAGLTVITGPQRRGRLGVWMASGDIDGDGFEDIVVGADMAGGRAADAERDQRGRVYVLYGPFPSDGTIDLSTSQRRMNVIYGVDPGDHAGSTVASGDVNGDGYDDVVIGAAALGTLRNAYDREGGAGAGPDNARPGCGELYVVFGGPDLPDHIELAASDDILTVYGADGGGSSPDRLGEEFVLADVDGDGYDDLLIGAYRADGPDNARRDAGETYVVYGSPGLPGRTIDMAAPPAGVTVIYGAREGAIIGDSISAGDIHGDGRADLFIGVPGDDGPLERRFSGGMAVIAGGDLPAVIDLADPSVPTVWIQAPDAFDFSAYWAAAGDMDGDGRVDPIPNGMAGDGPDNQRNNAGEAHIISGAALAQWLPATAPTAVEETAASPQPNSPALPPNFPNPFNAFTRIPFVLSADGAGYALDILSVNGQLIRRLEKGNRPAGRYQTVWDGRDQKGQPQASGVYLSRLRTGAQEHTSRLLLLK